MAKEIHKFVTIEMVMESFGWSRELAQRFIDLSIEKGMIIPLEDGTYTSKSEVILNKAREIQKVLNILTGEE